MASWNSQTRGLLAPAKGDERMAAQQDLITWKDFMEGKVSKALFCLQGNALSCSALSKLFTGV